MDILVGDLAKLYGLSSQTLHYYEEKGIINPKRSVVSGYRYFETADLSRIGAIKKHRNAGFSLNKSLQMYEEYKELELINEYNNRKDQIQKEIDNKMVLMNKLKETTSLYEEYKKRGQDIAIEDLEGFLRFDSPKGEIIVQDKASRQEATTWFSNIFYTNGSEMFYLDEDGGRIYHSTKGMLASLEMAEFLKLKLTENVKKIDGGRFVTAFYNTDVEEDYRRMVYRCIDYVKANNLEFRGLPFTRTILIFKNESNERKGIEQILIPIN